MPSALMENSMGVLDENSDIWGENPDRGSAQPGHFPLYAAAAFSVPLSTMHSAASAA